MTIHNPVLPGFHPDPSILRVGSDYYIANSTFEWFGGVEIHHSRNLADWTFVGRPLSTRDHLDLKGNPRSGGIWAPCLTWSDGLFWLIFTDVKSWNDGPFKDCRNYVTTAENIRGPWSPPVYVNSSGFDASLFHDDDGRKWFVNMEWDYRKPGTETFSGIIVQEFDPTTRTLVGPVSKIFRGTEIGLVEGPHLYKIDSWYYLVTAEGGTQWDHAVTVARSRNIFGPYEVHPANPLITCRGRSDLPLQKAGHGSWCDTPDGRWILAFLVGRPLPGRNQCPLGRETALAEFLWKEGWPYLKEGEGHPVQSFDLTPPLASGGEKTSKVRNYSFGDLGFTEDFMTLRTPMNPEVYSIVERPGFLRIHGRESLTSTHSQSLLARRQTDFRFAAETLVEFNPGSFQQMAGLIYRYDEVNQYYLRISLDEEAKTRTLGILVFDQGKFSMPLGDSEQVLPDGPVRLGLEVNGSEARFFWAQFSKPWQPIGPVLDAGKLSDDYGDLGFTGAFVGMACQDLQGNHHPADFSQFIYAPV